MSAYQRAAIALLSATGTFAAIVDYTFDVANTNIAPDGYVRSAVTVNGGFPGPLIRVNKGDTIRVNVTNNLDDPNMRQSTSIHWHGLFQNKSATFDGPAFVTQCPISPTWSFTYEIPTDNQGGTFWYHSHLGSQYIDGLRGPIVIDDPNDPNLSLYDVDNENTIIQVGDWYHNYTNYLEGRYLAASGSNTDTGADPVPDSGTINGKGRYTCLSTDAAGTCPTTTVDRAVIPVTQGQRYRMRFINNSGMAVARCFVQGHRLSIIEADGIPHNPLPVDYFDIYPGQRYSAVLTANQTVDNYWINCPMTVPGSTKNGHFMANQVLAVLRYSGAATADPTTTIPTAASGTALVEASLVPAIDPGSPGGASPSNLATYSVAFARSTTGSAAGGIAYKINGNQYIPPDIPTLLNILANGVTTSSGFATNENTVIINKGDIIELNISGGNGHPFHLHGHAFDVVKSASSSVTNYVNPPRRDVVATPAIIRFRADNPGPWILHCHFDWHFLAGLAMVFAEAPSDQITDIPHNAAWDALCNTYNALDPSLQ